ncbi:MAG: hypothetical protein NT023_15485, partial [Armatimonadetes bacterium]|nr:hypothetical protein [Armatimonadota bacterium]
LKGLIGRFATNMGRAGLLAKHEAHWGGWKHLYDQLPRYDKVTTADVLRVAKKYFTEKTRTVIVLKPENAAQGGEQK